MNNTEKVVVRGTQIADGWLEVKKVVITPEGTYVEDEYNTTCLAPQEITVILAESRNRVPFAELLRVYREYKESYDNPQR